jgi:hypothetical protein
MQVLQSVEVYFLFVLSPSVPAGKNPERVSQACARQGVHRPTIREWARGRISAASLWEGDPRQGRHYTVSPKHKETGARRKARTYAHPLSPLTVVRVLDCDPSGIRLSVKNDTVRPGVAWATRARFVSECGCERAVRRIACANARSALAGAHTGAPASPWYIYVISHIKTDF